MLKVLWLSNCVFTTEQPRATGTWIYAMGNALVKTGEVKILNITDRIPVKNFEHKNTKHIEQWIVPACKRNKKGLPTKIIIDFILSKEKEFQPDLIHIWGTEHYWGTLAAQNLFSAPVLLDMQGLMYTCAKVFYAGLNLSELLKCIGPKEIIFPNKAIFSRKKFFEKMGVYEKQIVKNIANISYQSDWIKTHIEQINPSVKLYSTGIILRTEFLESQAWNIEKIKNPIIFCSTSIGLPYKGLHILFRAFAILLEKIPNASLKIAGQKPSSSKIKSGYENWLLQEAKKLKILNKIDWLGPLDATQLITQMLESSLVVIPSFVESYSLALAEAMIVGVPTVTTYTAAMTNLAEDNKSTLFYPVGDEIIMAKKMQNLILDKQLAAKIGSNSRKKGLNRNNTEKLVENQIFIYKHIIKINSN